MGKIEHLFSQYPITRSLFISILSVNEKNFSRRQNINIWKLIGKNQFSYCTFILHSLYVNNFVKIVIDLFVAMEILGVFFRNIFRIRNEHLVMNNTNCCATRVSYQNMSDIVDWSRLSSKLGIASGTNLVLEISSNRNEI